MSGPLVGVRVVELTVFQQGPVAGSYLGDMGADVIKVEPPEGDPGRGFMRVIGVSAALKGRNFYFENQNRNKRSIVLDLKNASAAAVFLKLIDNADVFLTNLTIGAPERLGIGWETLRQRNPRLIYAHASGWGSKGPIASEHSFDYTGSARSGFMMSSGERGAPPVPLAPGIGDQMGGIGCAWAICAALYAREKTGRGQRIDASLLGSMITLQSLVMSAPCILGQEYPRRVRAESGNPLYNQYRCADDKWLVLAHLQPDRYWAPVCRALGLEELVNDPRFGTLEARSINAAELIGILDARFATRSRDAWLESLRAEGCIYTPVQSPAEVIEDPQALANDYIIPVEHPVWGSTRVVGFPWMFSDTPASWRREAPELGQHTEEILLELGYTWEDILALKNDGATT